MHDTSVSAWKQMCAASRERLHAVRHYLVRRQLEGELVSLVGAARAHEENGLTPGSSLYRVLDKEATRLCSEYCREWNIDQARLRAELPGLEVLRKLAMAKQNRRLSLVLLATVVGLIVSFLIGLAGGLVSRGFHLAVGGAR